MRPVMATGCFCRCTTRSCWTSRRRTHWRPSKRYRPSSRTKAWEWPSPPTRMVRGRIGACGMKLLPKYVISVDPGLSTGLALIASEGPELCDSREVEVLRVEDALLDMLAKVPAESDADEQHALLFVV